MNSFPKLSLVTRIIITIALIAAALVASTCGGESTPAAPPPVGATSGLNTFIYVYSDT